MTSLDMQEVIFTSEVQIAAVDSSTLGETIKSLACSEQLLQRVVGPV